MATRLLALLAAVGMLCLIERASAQDSAAVSMEKLSTSKGLFVDADSKPVILKGCNIGNWLMIEPWMIGCFEVHDQAELISRLQSRFGAEQATQLLDTYRDGFLQARDFEIIKSFGFNVVRVPFDHRLVQDDTAPYAIRPDAFRWLDRAVSLARAAGVYVILDLHGAPGGQSLDACTGKSGMNALWGNQSNLQRTADIWHAVADHFAGNPAVAAYDLLNEPFGNQQQDLRPDLKDLGARIYSAIRSADRETIILLPGSLADGIDFYGSPSANHYHNVGFTEHFYPGLFGSPISLRTHARLLNQKLPARADWLKAAEAPYLVGEFNVVLESNGGNRMMREYYDRFAEHGWAGTMWSYKFLKPQPGMQPNLWGMVTNDDSLKPIDLDTVTLEEMKQWCESIGSMKLAVNSELRESFTQKDTPPLPLEQFPLPPKVAVTDALPTGWTAMDIGETHPGGQIVKDGAITVVGGGSDIFGRQDSFRFVSRAANDSDELTAKVSPPLDTSQYAKSGLMIRCGDGEDAAFVMVNLFPDGTVGFCARPKPGAGAKESKAYPGLTEPISLRLSIHGRQVQAFYQQGDGSWISLAAVEMPAVSNTRIGLAVTGHDIEMLTEAKFEILKAERDQK